MRTRTWRFNEQYAGQVGAGIIGDLPNDFKFQYAGVALRGAGVGQPKYAIYRSLFVILPDPDPRGGTRTFPPFQGNPGGAAVNGGLIMRLKGKDIDLFLHLTGVRPGTILEVGDRFALSGAVAGVYLRGLLSSSWILSGSRKIRIEIPNASPRSVISLCAMPCRSSTRTASSSAARDETVKLMWSSPMRFSSKRSPLMALSGSDAGRCQAPPCRC